MRTLDLYIFKEFLVPFSWGMGLFSIFLSVDVLFGVIDFLINKGVKFEEAFKLFLLKMPAYMHYAIPMSAILGAVISIGKLAERNEILAMLVSGISLRRIIASVALIGAILTAVDFAVTEYVSPWCAKEANELMWKVVYRKPMPTVVSGVFFKDPEGRTYYINRFDRKNGIMKGIMIYEGVGNREYPRVTTADRGLWDPNAKRWVLIDGRTYEFDRKGNVVFLVEFRRQELFLNLEPDKIHMRPKDPREMSIRELASIVKVQKRMGLNPRGYETELNLKVAVPFACLILPIIAALLSSRSGRFGSPALGLGVSVVIIFFYYMFFSLGRALSNAGKVNPVIGAWLANFVFAGICLLMLAVEGRR